MSALQDAGQVFSATELCIDCAEPLPNHAADCATLQRRAAGEAPFDSTMTAALLGDPDARARVRRAGIVIDGEAETAEADFRAPLTLKISVARKVNLGIAVGSAETYAEVSNVTKDTTEAEILELLEGAGGVAWRAVANDVTAKVRQLREETER